jgi:hypothetical protein
MAVERRDPSEQTSGSSYVFVGMAFSVVSIPVVIAGRIATASNAAGAIDAGFAAVLVGTAFVAAEESAGSHSVHRCIPWRAFARRHDRDDRGTTGVGDIRRIRSAADAVTERRARARNQPFEEIRNQTAFGPIDLRECDHSTCSVGAGQTTERFARSGSLLTDGAGGATFGEPATGGIIGDCRPGITTHPGSP